MTCPAASVPITSSEVEDCWTFGTAFNRVQLIASVCSPAYGPKEDILSSDNMLIE